MKHQIGRRHAFAQRTFDAHADHFGDQHRHRLTEHRGLGFDTSDAPRHHAQAVDHGRVRVGADRGIRIRDVTLGIEREAGATRAEHDAREIFDVDLMYDAGVGRNRAEALERALSPLEEGVTLLIALELEVGILL